MRKSVGLAAALVAYGSFLADAEAAYTTPYRYISPDGMRQICWWQGGDPWSRAQSYGCVTATRAYECSTGSGQCFLTVFDSSPPAGVIVVPLRSGHKHPPYYPPTKPPLRPLPGTKADPPLPPKPVYPPQGGGGTVVFPPKPPAGGGGTVVFPPKPPSGGGGTVVFPPKPPQGGGTVVFPPKGGSNPPPKGGGTVVFPPKGPAPGGGPKPPPGGGNPSGGGSPIKQN